MVFLPCEKSFYWVVIVTGGRVNEEESVALMRDSRTTEGE